MALILFRLLWARKLPRRIWFRLSSPYSRIARQRLVYVSFDFSVWHWTSFTPFFPLSSCPVLSCPLSVQVRAAAAHKVKDFCLALDKSIQEQVIMNHLLPCVKVISFFVGLVEFFFSP